MSMNFSVSKILSGYLVMFRFFGGQKKRKNAFFFQETLIGIHEKKKFPKMFPSSLNYGLKAPKCSFQSH